MLRIALLAALLAVLPAASLPRAVEASSAGAAPGGAARTRVSLALDWFPNATHAGLYAALYEGYFAEEGLEVDIVVPADPATRLSLLATGRVDWAIESPGGVLTARAAGMPLVSVMGVVQSFLGAMMTLEESGIASVSDFRGKRIGTSGLPEARARLESVLQAAGIAPSEVTIIDIGWGQTAALLSGAVDVVTGILRTWQGVEAELEGYNVRFLQWEDYGLPSIQTLVLVTTEQTVAQRPRMVEGFVRAMVRGYQWAMDNPRQAAEYVLRADPQLRPELLMRSLQLLAPYFREPEPKVGWQSAERWEAYAAWMRERGLLSAPVEVSEAFTNRFVP